MRIEEYLDVIKLQKYIEEGIVDERKHPTLPLTILCYSRRATYENIWDDITCKCRGLIVADDGMIVSRPFEKFFNLNTLDKPETHLSNLPKVQPLSFDKLDGSLGTLYEWKVGDEVVVSGVASKGSFTSDHANWATAWYNKNCKNPQWPVGFTPVFEMICQSVQRHVVFYDMPDQLVLLALINRETGEEADYNTVYHYAFLNGIKPVEIFAKSVGDLVAEDRENKEGYVLSWPRAGQTPLKIKVKHETFLKLQKIVHAATPKAVLEALMDRDFTTIETWKTSAAPELAEFVERWSNALCESYGRILAKAKRIMDAGLMTHQGNRKEIAAYFLQPDNRYYSKICFTMLDGKDPSRPAWALVKDEFKDELTRPVMGDPYDDLEELAQGAKETLCQ
jgi:RNA ligase